VDLEKAHELARREADEIWQLVDEYTAMANRAESRAEEALEKYEDSKQTPNIRS
jgi:hypothetical protein